MRLTVQQTFDHHRTYHLSGMTAPWCAFCPQPSLSSGVRIGEDVKGKGQHTAAELRTPEWYSGVRSVG
jgi:hypothetical protein